MRKTGRALAMLLSAAMVTTSLWVPAMGAEEMGDELFEEAAVGAQEESVPETDESVAADFTEAVGEEEIEGQIGDAAKGDTFIVARNMEELLSQIEAAKPGEITNIVIEEFPNPLPNDEGFTISANQAPIEIGSGKLINLYLTTDVAFDKKVIGELNAGENSGKYDKYPSAKITVASGARLWLGGEGDFWFNIENEGIFRTSNDVSLRAYNGTVLDNKGEAVLEGQGSIVGYCCDQTILNEGNAVLNTLSDIYGTKSGEKTTENYAIVNKKSLIIENVDDVYANYDLGDNIAKGYGILNDSEGVVTIRGAAANIVDIYNKGSLEVGEENYYELYKSTSIGTIYTVEEGSVVQHDGTISMLVMGADKSMKKAVKSGTFIQVYGTANRVLFTDSSVLPIFRNGTVKGLRKLVEKDGELIIDDVANVKDYKYMGYRIDENDAIEREAFRLYDEKKDTGYDVETAAGEKYIIADSIISGIPYKNGKAMFDIDLLTQPEAIDTTYKPIATVDDLVKAAADPEGGYYYLVNDGDYAGTSFSIDKEITFTTPFFRLTSGYLYDEEKNYVSKYNVTIKDGGSFKISADSTVSIGTSINLADTTGTGIVNEGSFTAGSIFGVRAKKNLVENKGSADIYYVNSDSCEDVLVVNRAEGTLELSDLRDIASRNTDILNEGKLNINGSVSQSPYFDTDKGEYLKGLTIIENIGELEIESTATVTQGTQGGTAILNKGTLNVLGTLNGGAKATTVVKNDGSAAALNLIDGGIYAYDYDGPSDKDKKDVYAIVYTDNEPVLSGGVVYGSRGVTTQYIRQYKEDGTLDLDSDGNEKLVSAVYGSAVVKDGNTTDPGEFKISDSAAVVSGKNAGFIDNGLVPCSTDVSVSRVYGDQKNIVAGRCDYILMETGESIPVSTENALNEYAVFTLSIFNNTFGVKPETLFEISSTSDAVKVEEMTAASFDAEKYGNDDAKKGIKLNVINAVGTGMATVKAKSTITDSEDYIVIEVVKKDERAKIVASSYDAKLATENVNMNSYQRKIVLDVDWHLADYEKVTGSYSMENNFYPVGLDFRDSVYDSPNNITKYFTPGSFYRDGDTKTYKIELVSNLVPSSDGVNEMPYLVQDEMTKLEAINLVLIVKDIVSGKTLEVPIKQKLNISVKQQKPVVKFAKESINGAYAAGSAQSGFTPVLTGKSSQFEPFSNVTMNGDVHYFQQNGGRFEYTGPAKGGSFKLPVYATLRDYYGVYDSTISVSVRAAWPKVSIDKKSVSVPVKASDYENIRLSIATANPADVAAIDEVYTDDDVFEVVGQWSTATTYEFCLKPRADITSPRNVDLGVYYGDHLKKNKGKEYYNKLKLTVKPVANGKFKLGDVAVDNPLYASFTEATEKAESHAVTNLGTYVTWAPIPFDVAYTDSYFVVKSTDGKLLVSDNPGVDNWTNNDDHNGISTYYNRVYVEAGPNLTASDKSANIQVDWYAADGSRMSDKPLVISVPVNQAAGEMNDLKAVTIDLAKQTMLTKTELSKITGKFYLDNGTGRANEANIGDTKMGEIPNIDAWLNEFAFGSTALKLTNGTHLASVKYHGADDLFLVMQTDKKLYVMTKNAALQAGKIVPGTTYKLDVTFVSPNGAVMEKKLDVVIAGIKKVKATGSAIDEMSALTSYARARIQVNTQAPFYGLRVKEARLTGASASMFDLTNYTDEGASYVFTDEEQKGTVNAPDGFGGFIPQTYMLTWKDNTVPSGAKNGTMKVTLDVEYTCGAVAKVTVPITVFGAGVK